MRVPPKANRRALLRGGRSRNFGRIMPAPAFLPSLDGQAESCWRMPRSRLRTAWKSRWVDAGREQREARSRRRAHPFFSCRQILLPVACAQRHAAPLTQKTGKVASAGSHVAPASEVLRVQLHEAAAQGGKGLVGVPVEPGVDQRKAGTRKVLALSPHRAGASSSSSEACGAPCTKAAPAAAGSGAWVLRRPLDGLDFHHAQNSLVVDGELPACRVRKGGRGDERAMAWQSDGTVHKQTSCLVSGA